MRLHFLVPYPRDQAPSQHLKFEQYYGHFARAGYEIVHDAFYSRQLYQRLGKRGLLWKACGVLWACVKRLRSLWMAWRSDLVYVCLEAMPIGPPILEWVIVHLFKRPMVYDIDDLIYLKKPGSRDPLPTLFDRRRKVEFLMRSARHVIVCTPHLEKVARSVNVRVARISSTIDTVKYRSRERYDTPCVTIGWSGSFSTSPYLHLLDNVLRTVQQRHGVAIRVIGDARFSIAGVEVQAIPWRLESEVEDLLGMDIGLYPLPHEEWVLGKSGLKALQYMGLGIPTVLTPIGANLEIVEHGKNGFFADSEEEWTDALTKLIQDSTLREEVGRAGRKTVEDRYSVEANWPLYRRAVEEALGFPMGDARQGHAACPR
ncbi:MAG: glycosyltransferase family 1 protein [Nitrospirae bacterium]|nr:MAG: glycosyltransferase family 1 protein [Nitrospirota bacterium]